MSFRVATFQCYQYKYMYTCKPYHLSCWMTKPTICALGSADSDQSGCCWTQSQNICYHHAAAFLAHLSRRLMGELIGYPCSGVCPSYVVVVHNFKHLLRNHLPDQCQILCGASLGRGNESLYAASGSHDQDGRHAHIWLKPFKNLLQNRRTDFYETWYVASGTPAHHSLFK